MAVRLVHDEQQQEFVLFDEQARAGFASYDVVDGVRDFNHTVVDPAYRGQGLSSKIIAAALDDTRAQGLKARPTCSAVAHFVDTHPEYRDIVA